MIQRCPIPPGDTLFETYHDEEWGVPATSDKAFFEKTCLEGFQAGLSWQTILHRRETLRDRFAGFDFTVVAQFTADDINRLTNDRAIIRNRRKIAAAVQNARCALDLQAEFGSLAAFFWQFEPRAGDRPASVTQRWLDDNKVSTESTAMAKALKKRGWSFVGPTNMYALMQALGIVNDHLDTCFRRTEIDRLRTVIKRA